MKWGSPDTLVWLWLFLPAFGLIGLLFLRKEKLLTKLFNVRALPFVAPRRSQKRLLTKHIIWAGALLAIGFSLAHPQWGFHWQEVKKRGLYIIVVLDTSKSMLAEDIKPNRLQQAKWGIRDLVKRLEGDRIGLLSFAGSSYLQCPLTADYAAFSMTLDDVYAGIIPRGGTDIEHALETAVESFEARPNADRAILLITDGEFHAGDPLALLDHLKKENIYLFSVGIGTVEGELIPVENQQGRLNFMKDKMDRVIKSSLQEDVLERLAVATGGAYVRSTPGDIGLERIVDQGLARLKRAEHDAKMMKQYEERFVWFLGIAFSLLLLETCIIPNIKKVQGLASS